MIILPHLPLLDSALCDFFFFLKVKHKLKDYSFETMDEIKHKSQKVHNVIHE